MRVGRTAKNITAGYAGAVVNGITLLVLTPLVLRTLGPAEYGLWVLATAIGSYFGFLNAGSGAAGVRTVAVHCGAGRWDEASRELGSLFRIYTLLGFLACAGLLAVGALALGGFHVPEDHVSAVRALLALIAVNFLVSFPYGLTRSVLAGLHRFGFLNAVEIVTALLRLVGTWVLLTSGFGVVALGMVQLVTSVLGHLARYRAIRRLAPQVRLTGGPTYRGLVPAASWFSALSFGYESLRALFDNADLLILGLLAGPSSVGFFAVAATLASVVIKGLQPIAGVLFPLASESDDAGRARMLEVATRVNLALAMPVVTFLLVDGSGVLRLWAGEEVMGSLSTLRILVLASLVGASSVTAVTLLFGSGEVRTLLKAESWRYVINLALVVGGFKLYGLPGAAFGTLLATLGVDAFLLSRRACPWAGVDAREFFLRSVAAPVLAGLPVILALAIWKRWVPDPTPVVLALRGAVCLAGFVLVYALSGTFREERKLMERVFAEVFR